ncbi:MAG: CHAT domain-containing protein [Alphaproteobacteria bacterium]|nr:CHAT domain-containing protein [Alphaproteobacteria bacterium]
MRHPFKLAALLGMLAGCTTPPPDAYVAAHGAAQSGPQLSLGTNAVGEACTQQSEGHQSADVYCGTWQQPSARVRSGGPATAADLGALATGGAWRTAIDARFLCQPPVSTTILGGEPALMMQCTRRVGGWPHVAMVALVGGNAWLADGVLPATPPMERSIGVLSGKVSAEAAPRVSGADALLASRLAARAFSSGDVGAYEELMTQGRRANQAGNSAAAERAYRAALALHQKALGKDNPENGEPIMHLALQLSNQGRFAEADALFAQADKLVPKSADPTAPARLLHYRALNLLYQGKTEQALAMLEQAEAAYTASLPSDALQVRPALASSGSTNPLGPSLSRFTPLLGNRELLTDPVQQRALVGVIETRRYRGVALRALGRLDESNAALRSAADLQRSAGRTLPIETARLSRNSGVTASELGQLDQALSDLSASASGFNQALPGSKPVIETSLLRAGQLLRAGKGHDALPICRAAVRGLTTLNVGVSAELIAPCLDVYAAEAKRQPDQEQPVLAEMFFAAQVAQGGITTQQIGEATVRLQENARDPKVGEAIRRQQDIVAQLAELNRQRDELASQRRAPGPSRAESVADLDTKIADAQTALAEADSALQAASPNFGQLTQQVVPAKEVMAATHPGEAFAAITLSNDEGWVFLLRDGRIAVSKVDIGSKRVADLVRRVRAGIEMNASGLPRFDVAAARELYGATLGGVAPAMEGSRALTVAPTGAMLALPMEVLLTGPADAGNLAQAPWLVRKFSLSHVPAASNFVSLRRIAHGSRATQPWFGFGDFRPVTLAQAQRTFPSATCADSARLLAGLPRLAAANKELEAARLLLGAAPSDQLLGAAFTAANVQKASLQNYRVLHFAAHAVLPAELACQSDPAIITSAPPGAVDASGALLTSSDVVKLKLDADIVILSACNSGGPGGSVAGESLSGLARSFFYAGARSLLVTHWAVNDQVGAFVVADTLRRLHENPSLGVAGALRDTQLGMLADAGGSLPAEVAHPFFWAPLAVIGNGGEGLVTAQAGAPARRS